MPFPRVVGPRLSKRALELSGLSSPGACATAHRSFKGVAVRPEELNKFFRPLHLWSTSFDVGVDRSSLA
jgi:hypothetical protein